MSKNPSTVEPCFTATMLIQSPHFHNHFSPEQQRALIYRTLLIQPDGNWINWVPQEGITELVGYRMGLLFPAGMQDERKSEAGMQDCKGSAEGMKLVIFIAEHGNCWVFWQKNRM